MSWLSWVGPVFRWVGSWLVHGGCGVVGAAGDVGFGGGVYPLIRQLDTTHGSGYWVVHPATEDKPKIDKSCWF